MGFMNESLEFDVLFVEEKLEIAEQLLNLLKMLGGDNNEDN